MCTLICALMCVQLLVEHLDIVAPDPHDALHELLDDLGEVHDVDFLIGNSHLLCLCVFDVCVITRPPHWPVLFCSLASVICWRRLSSSVMLPGECAAGRRTGRWACGRSGGRHCMAGQYGYVPLWRHVVAVVMDCIAVPAVC